MTSFDFDDRPLNDPDFDKLGFKVPADILATFFARKHCPEGFVAAVTGEWGSGKTTFINFMIKSESLYSGIAGLPQLEVIKFDPWIISGHQNLIAAFFKSLSDELETNYARAKNLMKQSASMGTESAKELVESAAKIAVIADGGILTKPAAMLVNKSIDSAVKTMIKEPSLQKAYGGLRNLLARSNRRFLVIIDDIDRLSEAEIRTIFQMVKSVG